MGKTPSIIARIQFLLISAVFLVPLFSINYLAYSVIEKTLLFYLLVEIAFGLCLYVLFKNKEYLPPRNTLLITSGVFLFFYTLAGVLAVSPEFAFWSTMTRMSGLILVFHIAAFVLLLVATFRDERVWRNLMGAAVVSGILVTAPTYLTSLSLNHSNTLINSTFGNSSYTAAFLSFSLFFSLILFSVSKTREMRMLFAVCAAFIFFSPLFLAPENFLEIFTNPIGILGKARAASASIFVGLTMAAIVYVATSKRKLLAYVAKIIFVICFIFLIAVSALVFVPNSPVQEKLDDTGIGSRLVFWDSAIAGIKERPLFGYGPENYFVPFYQYFEPELLTAEYDYETYTSKPHSAYLEVLVSGGVVSFVFYMMIWAVAFFLLWKLWKAATLARSELALLTGLLFAYLLQNIVLFDTLASYMGIGILIAYLVYVDSSKVRVVKYPSISRGRVFSKALLVFLILAPAVYFFVLTPVLQQAKLISLLEDTSVVERPKEYKDLFTISAGNNSVVAEYLMFKTLEGVPAVLAGANTEQRDLLLKDIAALQQTAQLYVGSDNSAHYRHLLYLAQLSLLESTIELDPEERDNLLELVQDTEILLEKLSPNNPQHYWVKAQRELLEGNAEVALSTVQATNQHVPNIPKTEEILNQIQDYLHEGGPVPFFIN